MPWYGFIRRSHGDGTSKDWYGVSSHSGEPALRQLGPWQCVVWNSRKSRFNGERNLKGYLQPHSASP
ncbi:hypothetical protein KL941_005435, partial [Ogataea angusta]